MFSVAATKPFPPPVNDVTVSHFGGWPLRSYTGLHYLTEREVVSGRRMINLIGQSKIAGVEPCCRIYAETAPVNAPRTIHISRSQLTRVDEQPS